jgi:hypothetical protein
MRYQLSEGSQSGHCCFDWTVIDTKTPHIIGKGQYRNSKGELEWEGVCECFEKKEAERICEALNEQPFTGGDHG